MLKRNQLNTILFNRLDSLLKKYGEGAFHESHWQWIFPNCIEPFLLNIRDINRLCNLLEFKFASLYEDIDFADMVAITTLEVVNPQLFQWIVSNKDILTGKRTMRESYGHSHKSEISREQKKEEIESLLKSINGSYSDIEINSY